MPGSPAKPLTSTAASPPDTEPRSTTFPSREDTSQVRLLADLAKIHATFDDPDLVSRAGLVPVMALA